jgi:hypothetical protein
MPNVIYAPEPWLDICRHKRLNIRLPIARRQNTMHSYHGAYHSDKLARSLHSQLSLDDRQYMSEQFWGCDVVSKEISRNLNLLNDCYLRYQEEQRRLAILITTAVE